MSATLSVTLITFNEEKNLARTLTAIKDIADEIIIVDSGSTDNTVKIAESFGAKIFREAWRGYSEQKNFALQKCSKEYILSFDGDEVPDARLLAAIQEVLRTPKYAGYAVRRHAVYMGKMLKHAFCDTKLRLVKRSNNPVWQGEFVHEALHVEGKTEILPGILLHYSYDHFEEHLARSIHYGKLNAQKKFAQGERFSLFKLIINPKLAFLKSYILKLGFLDGLPGYIVSKMRALDVFEKYLFLWELNQK
jgi:glycosyltransferase involved in cell wall biosynthesis